MRILSWLTLILICVLVFSSCVENTATSKITASKNINERIIESTNKVVGSPWIKQFEDTFDVGSTLSKWTKVQRTDYNSKYCDYDISVPTVQLRDGRGCLEIKTTKLNATKYQSGLIKSVYKYKPENNTEYMLSANIKLLAMDGSNYISFADTYGAWPAFWTVQEDGWPMYGEIDIMEGYSFAPNAPRFTSNLFYGTASGANQLGNMAEQQYPRLFNVNGNHGWHLYQCFWKIKNNVVTVTIMVDNTIVSTNTNSTIPKLNLNKFENHNIILNLNVGSNDSSFINPNKINLFTTVIMWVDDVTVYKKRI
ncbi:family 16 glycosylhydrolase [Flavobacterium sp. XN-5]|uniref:glycoside hydrolase family 16 protein n=1 Tax=Flavobacterium sp. XN-5 TaxID=2599390 RepID=UPI0011C729F8|nr:family 16 glycosylhydrolase [Flavobacterium sp. XN-5]NGY36102.1 family 16 glycosylhydrolase [Flavobacterium sp. XN-5]